MFSKLLAACGLLALASCAPALLPEVSALEAPANPDLGLRPAASRPIIDGYTHREPADPLSWRKLNQDQSPGKSSDKGAGGQ